MAAPSSYEAVLPQQLGPQVFLTPPAHPTPKAEIISALRTISALDGLTDEEYGWLATNGIERVGDDGAMVFTDGSPCDSMIFILKGEVHVRRQNAGPMALWIGRAGQMTAKASLLPHEDLRRRWLHRRPQLVASDSRESLPRDARRDPFHDAALRLHHDGSRPRSHAHGAAGREARRSRQARRQSRPRAQQPGLGRSALRFEPLLRAASVRRPEVPPRQSLSPDSHYLEVSLLGRHVHARRWRERQR